MGRGFDWHGISSLRLVVFLAFVISQATAFPSNEGHSVRKLLQGQSGEDILAAAIILANNATSYGDATPTYSLVLTVDVTLTKLLPTISSGSILKVSGACVDAAGTPRKCIIDGAHQFQIFTDDYEYPGGVILENLQFQNAVNGIVNGTTLITARNCIFKDNVDYTFRGGAVFMLHHGTAYVPLQITNCQFINNTAYQGHGGAIWIAYSYGNPQIQIANSLFDRNTAVTGAGGAIKSGASYLYCRNCTFTNNYALLSGGAVRHKGFNNLTFIDTTFTNNTSERASGGGLAFSATYARDGYSSKFCNVHFQDNKVLNTTKQSANIYLDYAYRDDTNYSGPAAIVSFCTVPAPTTGFNITPSGLLLFKLDSNCTGCSGCIDDCGNRGSCTPDADYNYQCHCPDNYDTLRNCEGCIAGSLASKNCVGCENGFTANPNGTCTACPGLVENYFSGWGGPVLDRVNYYSTATSPEDCQAQCDSHNSAFTDPNTYCNYWAYWGSNATAPCIGKCVLLYNSFDCYNGTMYYDDTYGIYTQNDDRLNLGCPF